MSVRDWDWGYCARCRYLQTLTDTGVLDKHGSGFYKGRYSAGGGVCEGSGELPATEPETIPPPMPEFSEGADA